MSSSSYSAYEMVMNEYLCSLGPKDIVRLFYTLSIKGLIPEAYGISEDLNNSLKVEIKKKKAIHSKMQKGQTEINKCLTKCFQNVIICQIYLVLNLEIKKLSLYLKAICRLNF